MDRFEIAQTIWFLALVILVWLVLGVSHVLPFCIGYLIGFVFTRLVLVPWIERKQDERK